MKYATVCSGVEAPSAAWEGLGWKAQWFSEIESFPCRVLKHHFPTVPNLGDMTKLSENETYQNTAIDLLCGGTPCQSFSTAGLRQGMASGNGQLAMHFIRILAEKRPKFFVWENVPGVFSSAGGQDFAAILAGFTGRQINVPADGWGNSGIIDGIPDAYGIAWRVLDAQYFGVPQRRNRVFVIGCLGDWRPAAAVLFEPESMRWNSPPRRETGKDVAETITRGAGGGSGGYNDRGDGGGNLICVEVAPCLTTTMDKGMTADRVRGGEFVIHSIDTEFNYTGDQCGTLLKSSPTGGGRQPIVMAHGQPNAEIVRDGSPSLTCNHESPIVFNWNRTNVDETVSEIANSLQANSGQALCYGIPGNWIGRKPENGGIATEPPVNLSPCLTKADRHGVAYCFQPRVGRNGRGNLSPVAYPLTAEAGKTSKGDSANLVCFAQNSRDELREMNVSGALCARPGVKQQSYLRDGFSIRRLTPLEYERLQGFPDQYTKISGKTKDAPRYRACGNSMAVPVMRWIGERIDFIHQIKIEL